MPLGERRYVLSQLFFLIIIIENHILPFSTLIKVSQNAKEGSIKVVSSWSSTNLGNIVLERLD